MCGLVDITHLLSSALELVGVEVSKGSYSTGYVAQSDLLSDWGESKRQEQLQRAKNCHV